MRASPLTVATRLIPSPLTNTYRTFAGIMTGASPSAEPIQAWIDKQEPIAWTKLQKNIHPKGTAPGCIVASPSRATNKLEPNYW